MGAPYCWTAKEPAVEWFGTIPFGMNPEGMAAWFYQADGLKLWEETYGAFNLVPRPATIVPPQMAGWFRRKITTIGDYKGLKMRMGPRLGGKVIARAGATAVLTPGAEIFAALERGVVDAAEWSNPHDDMILGLHKTARYYYYPGWQEPGLMNDFGFNKKAYEARDATSSVSPSRPGLCRQKNRKRRPRKPPRGRRNLLSIHRDRHASR